MLRASALCVLLAVAACGEGAKAQPAPPEKPPALVSSGPFEVMFDDAQLEARVLEAARSGRVEGLSALKLPPRCDRVRVAVRVLHASSAPPRDGMLSALDALAKCEGGASSKALAPLVATWRTWTDEQFAAERTGAPGAAPKSPAAAERAYRRIAPLVLAITNDALSDELSRAIETSRKLYDGLGWPGGWAALVDGELLPQLLAKNSKSFVASYFADAARAAYAASGDEFRAALVFFAQAKAAEKDGDFVRAERAAAAARDRLLPTGARGREVFDVLSFHGVAAQKVAQQVAAARDLAKALDEAKYANFDAKTRASVAEPLATSLFRLGRFDEARALANEAANWDPTRVELIEIAAESATELGDGKDGSALYRLAASRGDERMRDARLLFAARALAKGGDSDGAAKAVGDVLLRPISPPLRAFAAGVLREAGRLDDADHELSRAFQGSGVKVPDDMELELGRLAAAKGDVMGARGYFGGMVERLTTGDADAMVGWDLAQPLLDWARVEMGAGRLYEASELAGRAIGQLLRSGLDWELDKARKLYVDLQRRRGWFLDAEKATTQRLAAQVGDVARKEDVLLDLLFIRLELVQQRAKDAEANARATAALFADDWRRTLAVNAVQTALGRPAEGVFAPPESLDVRSRWGLLRDLVWAKSPPEDVASRAGAAEPELRRWALTKRLGAGFDEFLVESRRRADPTIPIDLTTFVEKDDEAVLLVEPIGAKTIVRLLLKGRIVAADVEGDAGLADFWDATWVAPSPQHLDAAAKRVSESLFSKSVVDGLARVKRLWISVPEPLGPLPFDLLSFDGKTLLDRFEVLTTPSLSEVAACRARTVGGDLRWLTSPYATLDLRGAVVTVGGFTRDSFDAQLRALKGTYTTIRDSSSLRDLKLALRKESKPDPKRPSVPAWACFLLRGAP